MLRMIDSIDLSKFSNRTWVYTSGDAMSIEKARVYEKGDSRSYQFVEVPRARKVGEGLLSTMKSSFISGWACVNLLLMAPDLILTNGPGTAVIICGIAYILKFFGILTTRIVYIESLARVEDLSLSGKLLRPICNRFIVQWPQLAAKYPGSEYFGIMV